MNHQSHSKIKADLDEDRIKLLRKINECSSHLNGMEGGEGVHLDHLKAQYNELMDCMDDYNRSPLSDPLEAFPTEIWQDIIAEIFELAVGSRLGEWGIDSLLPLTLVSKSWKHNILSTPRFWTRIQIYRLGEDLEAKLATCIHLSKKFPLNIDISSSKLVWDVVGPILIPQRLRIRSLSVTVYYPSVSEEAVQTPLINFLKSFGNLPALENLSVFGISEPRPNLDFLLESATRMYSVKGVYVSPEILRLDSMRTLRSLQVQQPFNELLPHLRNLHCLREVRFFSYGFGFNDTTENTLKPEREEDDLKRGQEPWEWTSLSLSHYPSKLIWSLLNSVSYTLHDLSVRIPCDLLSKLMIACSHMAQLFQLSMYLIVSRKSDFNPNLVTGYRSGIQILSVSIEQSHHDSTDPDPGLQDTETTKQISEALTIWSPEVQTLIFFSTTDSFVLLSYIRNLQRLTSLSTGSFVECSETSMDCELHAVQNLYISGKHCFPALKALSCPNVLSLTVQEYGSPQSSALLEPLHLQANRWLNLRSIEIKSDNVSWENISLPLVETIALGSSGMMAFEPIHMSSSLFKELACHSIAFPSLNCLEIRRFPEWDVFFIMLERRNLSILKEAAMITKLKLPSFPAPMLLQPLSDLLRGRIRSRPSNFDISLQGLAKAYFDRDLTGCGECHKSFQPCIQPTPPPYYLPHQFQNRDVRELQIPPYPSNEDEVLATCLQRAVWWKDTVQNFFERHSACNRHETYDPVEITGYTCSGLFDTVEPIY